MDPARLHYRGFEDVDDACRVAPDLCRARRLEADLERRLRAGSPPWPSTATCRPRVRLVEDPTAPSLAPYVQRHADGEQVLAPAAPAVDQPPQGGRPHRLGGAAADRRAKAALVELLYDEYGGGRAARLHSGLFGRGMAASGLDPTYGAYIDEAPTEVLEQNNAMTLFGLHRRLPAAAVGPPRGVRGDQLDAFAPVGPGSAAAGLAGELAAYYPEHVEADAVHEQLAVRGICVPLVEADRPAATTSSSASSPASTRRTASPAHARLLGRAA